MVRKWYPIVAVALIVWVSACWLYAQTDKPEAVGESIVLDCWACEQLV